MYQVRREHAFIVAVNCGQAGGTCFCVSMKTGPKATVGIRSGADGGAGGRPAPVCAGGRVRAGRRGAPGRAARRRGPRRIGRGADGGGARGRRRWAARWTLPGSRISSTGTTSIRGGTTSPRGASPAPTARWSARPASAHRRRHGRPDRRARRAVAEVGLLLHAGSLLHPRWQRPRVGALAISSVDDPQARDLDRSVRHVGLRGLRALHHVVPRGDRHHRRGPGDPRERASRGRRPRKEARQCGTIDALLADTRCSGASPDDLAMIAGCGSNVQFKVGTYLFHEGDPSDQFYLIRHGRVGLEIASPGRGRVTFATLGRGRTCLAGRGSCRRTARGADARAVELVRATAFDGACIRKKCEEDPRLGYELLKRFAQIVGSDSRATRMQLLDVYGTGASGRRRCRRRGPDGAEPVLRCGGPGARATTR